MTGDFRLGDWQVQPATCRLFRGGVTVEVRAKVMDLLVYLARHPGEVVTKDHLLDDVWGTDAISESALTRTIAELRRALDDHVDHPTVLETIPKRGYRLIAPVHDVPGPPSLDGPAAAGDVRPRTVATRPASWLGAHRTMLAAAGLVMVLAAGVVLFLRTQRHETRVNTVADVARVTFEPGLQIEPSFSPDGRYLAYAANTEGNFDVWVRPVAGGDAIRVTSDPANDWQPDWAPDGSRILFRSERGSGGVFVVPAFGGRERQLTDFGYRPRWSPDGTRFLFVSALLGGSASGATYIGTTDGSPPHEVRPRALEPWPGQLVGAIAPNVVWHPDGRRLSYLACSCVMPGIALFTLDPTSGRVVRSQVDEAVAEAVAHLRLSPHDSEAFAWSPRGDAVYVVGYSSTLDVWKFDVRPDTLAIVGGPHRITNGSGAERNLAVSRDGTRVAYAEGSADARLWVWRLDATGSRLVGEPEPVTRPGLKVWRPDLTRDGRTLVFGVSLPGRVEEQELRLLGLGDKSERALSVPVGGWFTPRWSRDGTRIAYRYSSPGRSLERSIRVVDLKAGRDWQLTSPVEGLSDNAFDWSADGQYVIACGNRYRPGSHAIAFVPVGGAPSAERQARVVTTDTDRALWQAMLSPNGRWIAFEAVPVRDARVTRLYIVGVDGGEWVPLTDGTAFDDKPRWSDDGRLLYFMSSKGGTPNVWALPIDPERGRPAGVPYPLTRFDTRTSLGVEHIAYAELAVGGGRMVVPVAEAAASIWMIEAAVR